MATLAWVWLFAICPSLLVVMSIAGYRLNSLLISGLRARHSAVWVEIGEPTIWGALRTFGLSWSVLSSGRRSYVGWLLTRGFDKMGDSESEALGSRLVGLQSLLAVLLIQWVAVAWLLGYLHGR